MTGGRVLRLGTLAVSLLFVGGCLAKPAIVPQTFSIDPPPARPANPSAGVVLALSRADVAPPYSGQRLMYRTGEHEVERDPYARFIAPPGWLLTVAIGGYLSNADFVRDVALSGRGARADALVEVAVTQLVGDVRDGESSAVLALRFRVIAEDVAGSRSSEILLKTYSRAIPIRQVTARDVVDGWNRGLAEIMVEFEPDLRAALTVAGLPARSEPPRVNDPGSR